MTTPTPEFVFYHYLEPNTQDTDKPFISTSERSGDSIGCDDSDCKFGVYEKPVIDDEIFSGEIGHGCSTCKSFDQATVVMQSTESNVPANFRKACATLLATLNDKRK